MENTRLSLELNQTTTLGNEASTPTAQGVTNLPNAMLYTQKETFVKKTATGSLRLTNYRLIWKDSDTIVVLPVDAITFIGYKKQTNWAMLIFGIFLTIIGLLAGYQGANWYGGNSDIVGIAILLLLVGVVLAHLSIKKFIVFATSGGEMFIKSDRLEHLNEWIDAVSAEREKLKRGL